MDSGWQVDEALPCCECGRPARTVSFSFEGAFHLRCLVRFWEEFFHAEAHGRNLRRLHEELRRAQYPDQPF